MNVLKILNYHFKHLIDHLNETTMFIRVISRTLKAFPVLLFMLPVSPAALATTPQCTYIESSGKFNVSWADSNVYKYIVERSVNSSPWYWRGAVLDDGISNYQFQDNGNAAPPDSSVRYRLQTKAANNASPAQEPMLCQLKDVERPSQATSIKVVALSSNSMSISWQAATDNVAVDRYLIYRAPADGAVAIKVGETSDLLFTDVGLNPSTNYWYFIKAVDTSGNVGWRTGYHFNTTLDGPPSATPDCTVTEKPGRQFDISWRDTDVYKYIVERSVNGSTWYWRGAAVDTNQSQYQYSDTGATPADATVVYRLQTKAVDNNSLADDPKICELIDQPPTSERFATANVGGRWEIVDTDTAEVVRWNAVNVRSDKFIGNSARPLGAEDIQALSMVFDTIRLSIHWDQLHIGPGQFNQSLLQKLKSVLDYAEQYDVNVVLDPVHLGGGNNFWMPLWVWQRLGLNPSREDSFELLNSNEIRQYLHWIMDGSGLGDHPAVVAVEVVNEPHPAGSNGAWTYERQRDLMLAYKPMVATIRQHRPDIIVVLGSYYGGHLFDNGLGDGNAIADVFAGTPNLVWTAHNYFTGIEPQLSGPDYDGDGSPDLDGQGYRGTRGAGVWTESYDSSGCYAQNPPYVISQCDTSLPLRATALQGHANNAANHDRVAQQAGMPFFMGEFGMGRVRVLNNNTIGWNGTQAYMCDKLQAYRDLKLNGSNIEISWAVWAFDSQVDGGFGLYNSSTNQWVPETSNAFFGQCP